MPSTAPSNGLDTANQKETSQPESFAFVFTLFSQALDDQHFRKLERRRHPFVTGRDQALVGFCPASPTPATNADTRLAQLLLR